MSNEETINGNTRYGLKALALERDEVMKQPKPGRNNRLNEAACKLANLVASGHLNEDVVEKSLEQACWVNGLAKDDGINTVLATIRSGLRAGMKSPRGPEAKPNGVIDLDDWELSLQWADTIDAKEKEWLWPGVLPNREFVIIAGDPGIGKSFIVLSAAASITTGTNWPASKDKAPLGKAIYLSTEDDPNDTIKPRLIACGADPSMVGIITTMKRGEQERPFSLKDDIPKPRKTIESTKDVKLVVVDTIGNHMGQADRNKANDVRDITTRLTAIAREYDICVVGVTHLNKNEKGSALQRIMGSTDWTGAARAVWVVDKDDSGIRKMTAAKVNHAGDNTGYDYTLQPTIVEGIPTAKIVWGKSTFEQNANQMLKEKGDGGYALNEAKELCRGLLPNLDSRIDSKVANKVYAENGISDSTWRRAKKDLGVITDSDDNWATTYLKYKDGHTKKETVVSVNDNRPGKEREFNPWPPGCEPTDWRH